MTTLVSDVIERGFARSFANKPGTIATSGPELVAVVNRAAQEMFAVAADEHPEAMGTIVPVQFVGTGWARPTGAETVFRIELANGTEVFVVPYDDRTIEAGNPAIYHVGGVYYSAGNVGDPTSGQLNFFISPPAQAAVDATNTVDTRIPDTYMPVLEATVAEYLALKDDRPQDAAAFMREKESWMVLWIRYLQRLNANQSKRTGIPRRIAGNRPRQAPRG